jgi:dihydrofolate reductase
VITLIVAAADNGVMGRENELPWHLPEDLRRFKRLTLGKPVVMGRKTHESIGRPLPGRHNIVVTRDQQYRREGVTVVHGVDEALRVAGDVPEIMVIGGAELFQWFLPRAGRVHLTRVHAQVPGDVMWPALDEGQWRRVHHESRPADEQHVYPMTFEVWERPQSSENR